MKFSLETLKIIKDKSSSVEAVIDLPWSRQIPSKPCHDHGKAAMIMHSHAKAGMVMAKLPWSRQACHGNSFHDHVKDCMVTSLILIGVFLRFSWAKFSLRKCVFNAWSLVLWLQSLCFLFKGYNPMLIQWLNRQLDFAENNFCVFSTCFSRASVYFSDFPVEPNKPTVVERTIFQNIDVSMMIHSSLTSGS